MERHVDSVENGIVKFRDGSTATIEELNNLGLVFEAVYRDLTVDSNVDEDARYEVLLPNNLEDIFAREGENYTLEVKTIERGDRNLLK